MQTVTAAVSTPEAKVSVRYARLHEKGSRLY